MHYYDHALFLLYRHRGIRDPWTAHASETPGSSAEGVDEAWTLSVKLYSSAVEAEQ